MTSTSTRATAKEDRVPFGHMLAYGAGAFANNLLAGSIPAMMIVLNLGLGMDPALVGLLASIPRFFDAFTDPVMGYISDKTKTRWGRRRPFIFIGAILVGISFIMLWQMPSGQSDGFYFWYFLIGSLIFYLAYTCFATPWVALGYELTPDYYERSRLMGVQNFIGQLAYLIPPWLLPLMNYTPMFENTMDGASGVGIAIGVLVMTIGIIPAIVLRERFAAANSGAEGDDKTGLLEHMLDFLKGFLKTITFIPFLKLCLATFLIFNGFQLIGSFQTYVMIYYVAGGDEAVGARYMGYFGTLQIFSTFAIVAFMAWLSTRIGKQRALMFSTVMFMAGSAMKWVLYSPDNPLLILWAAPVMAFGYAGLFTIAPAMMADVVDLDEVKTGERREGLYGAIFWWVVKLGLTVALAGSGFLLNATGFDVDLGAAQSENSLYLMRVFDVVVPVIASAVALLAIASFDITPKVALRLRDQLKALRQERAASANPAIA